MSAGLYLFDDARARRWEPFALTRPAAELVFGSLRLWERAARAWGMEYRGHLAAAHLAGFREDEGPGALAASDVDERAHRILVSSRAVVRSRLRELPPVAAELYIGGARVGWSLPAGIPLPHPRDLADPAAAPRTGARLELDGFVLEQVWELLARAPAQLREDLEDGMFTPPVSAAAGTADGRKAGGAPGNGPPIPSSRSSLPPGTHLLGDGLLALGPGAAVEPGVMLDTGPGPIVLGEGVRVSGPARLEGPLYVGPGSTILGGRVCASYAGPACRIRGDIEKSVLLGYDNKTHGGFLGRSYLGRWVNLGAMTTNSDLRNDYRDVKVRTGEGAVSSGLTKLGCLVGDHVKTGIGTLLNTGAVIGAGCNLFGAAVPTSHLPPFRWGATPEAPPFRLDRFLDTAAHVMSRRGVRLTPEMRAVLERAWLTAAGVG